MPGEEGGVFVINLFLRSSTVSPVGIKTLEKLRSPSTQNQTLISGSAIGGSALVVTNFENWVRSWKCREEEVVAEAVR